jgi:L-alanine-DL-glutamate epimerase-like enolase superfamily enzyme
MAISSIEIRVCRNARESMSDSEMRIGGRSSFDFLVISMKTSEGIEGNSFGFAGRGAEMAGESAASALKPFFLSKDPLAQEKHWQDFRMYDRWWNHVPIYSYGPFDICLYDIAAKAAGLPLYRLLGSYRDKVPTYASSFVLPTPDDYARQALEVKSRGWHAYKLHPPGKIDFDLKAYRACRDAVGPAFKLIADPVAAYSHEEALRVGRELARLNYYWLEEPLFDVDFQGLRRLTAKLDIPIIGTEVLAGSHYSTA